MEDQSSILRVLKRRNIFDSIPSSSKALVHWEESHAPSTVVSGGWERQGWRIGATVDFAKNISKYG